MVCLIPLVGHLWTRSGSLWVSHPGSVYIEVSVSMAIRYTQRSTNDSHMDCSWPVNLYCAHKCSVASLQGSADSYYIPNEVWSLYFMLIDAPAVLFRSGR